MTLQEAKDQIAKNHEYNEWDCQLYENGHEFMEKAFNEVAQLFAESAADKAWEVGVSDGIIGLSELWNDDRFKVAKETFMKELFKDQIS